MKNHFLMILLMGFVACKGNVTNKEMSEVKFQMNKNLIGDEWSRKKVDISNIEKYSSIEKRLFKSVVKIVVPGTSGTGFYVGKHDGEYIFMTNHHVLPSNEFCIGGTSILTFNNAMGFCKNLIASWPSVDIAIFSVSLTTSSSNKLDSIEPLELELSNESNFKDPFITAGFGRFQNSESSLTYTDDEFCQQVSENKWYRRIEADSVVGEPKVKKKTWSLMHGCEGSNGDSGSPILNKETGKVIGIYWGGKNPKGNRFVSDKYVRDAINNNKKKIIWNKFNMAVPLSKIQEKVEKHINTATFSNRNNNKKVLESLFN